MSNSTHKVEVFRINSLEKHPNADSLSIVKFYGYDCIVRTSEFNVGDLACYVPPDNILPEKPEYEFLRSKKFRVKAMKLRGVQSQGLVLKAPEGSKEGDDVAALLGITHYVPPERFNRGNGYCVRELAIIRRDNVPQFEGSTYDIESYFRYGREFFNEGDPICITEKIHGANWRATYQPPRDLPWYRKLIAKIIPKFNHRLFVGSRNLWRSNEDGDVYWGVLKSNPSLVNYLEKNPGVIVYGEIYGKVQDLHYGLKEDIKLVVFDIYHPSVGFLDPTNIENKFPEVTPVVPKLYEGTYSDEVVRSYISGLSILARKHGDEKQIREGIVIRNLRTGRKLKAISPDYLERS